MLPLLLLLVRFLGCIFARSRRSSSALVSCSASMSRASTVSRSSSRHLRSFRAESGCPLKASPDLASSVGVAAITRSATSKSESPCSARTDRPNGALTLAAASKAALAAAFSSRGASVIGTASCGLWASARPRELRSSAFVRRP